MTKRAYYTHTIAYQQCNQLKCECDFIVVVSVTIISFGCSQRQAFKYLEVAFFYWKKIHNIMMLILRKIKDGGLIEWFTCHKCMGELDDRGASMYLCEIHMFDMPA